jgi:hypothetical protein
VPEMTKDDGLIHSFILPSFNLNDQDYYISWISYWYKRREFRKPRLDRVKVVCIQRGLTVLGYLSTVNVICKNNDSIYKKYQIYYIIRSRSDESKMYDHQYVY